MARFYKVLLFSLGLILFLAGCSDDGGEVISSSTPGDAAVWNLIETEPTLSLDGKYVYFVGRDTSDSSNDGIFQVLAVNPVRNRVCGGSDLHSPAPSPDNKTIAYLQDGRIHYYEVGPDSAWSSSITQVFASITYVNDSLMVGCSGNNLYLLNEGRHQATFLSAGYDPNPYNTDMVAYIYRPGENTYVIAVRNVVSGGVTVIDTISSQSDIGWASIERLSGRYEYSRYSGDSYIIFSGDASSEQSFELATVLYEKAYIIGFNTVIFTGADGRLYRCNFDGTNVFPFWGTLDVEGS